MRVFPEREFDGIAGSVPGRPLMAVFLTLFESCGYFVAGVMVILIHIILV